MTFEEGLKAKLASDSDFASSEAGQRIADILSMRKSKRRDRILARMEAYSRAHTEFNGSDWSKVKAVDWSKILQLLTTLLPLILKIFGL